MPPFPEVSTVIAFVGAHFTCARRQKLYSKNENDFARYPMIVSLRAHVKCAPTKTISALAALAFSLLATAPAPACGPDFPNAYLSDGSVSLLSAPEGYFTAEIAKIAAPKKSLSQHDNDDPNAALITAANAAKLDDELTETGVLRLSLAKAGYTKERINALAAELEIAREIIFAKAWNKPLAFSPDMPAEVTLYLKGAVSYWKNEYSDAREHWNALLALPESDRRHYTVNATYMIGRTFVPDSESGTTRVPEKIEDEMCEGARWLRFTREAAAAGYEDLSGLADASYGWEARAWFLSGDPTKAIHLYLEQHKTGNTTSAVNSLRIVAKDALDPFSWGDHATLDKSEAAKTLAALAQDEPSRRVLTVYLLARFGIWRWSENDAEKRLENQSRAWAAVLEKANLRNVPDTDRLAWIAYQAGYYELAQTWVALAPDNSAPGNWIRAKLALRAGDVENGERLLEKVTSSKDLTGEARPVAWADLGRVRMGRSNYTGALDAFIRGGHWEDTAYIAERVLTLDELRGYVDNFCPKYSRDASSEHWAGESETYMRNATRYLLARRLARANLNDEAHTYFPKPLRKGFNKYIADVRAGFDVSNPVENPASKRAQHFWRAAQFIRDNGMEILGTELAPDYFIWGGSFEAGEIPEARKGALRPEGGPGAPSAGELTRLEKHTVPEKRFHYRYRAAELGWWAASLMPNESEQTANMLNTAGSWIKNRDPQAAKQFYQALVIRCGNTDLGKAAAAKSWFPDTPARE